MSIISIRKNSVPSGKYNNFRWKAQVFNELRGSRENGTGNLKGLGHVGAYNFMKNSGFNFALPVLQ